MGLFAGRRLSRSSEFHLPIRLHSEHSLASLGDGLARSARWLGSMAIAATNNAVVVAFALLIAAAALAFEMAKTFPR